MCNPALWEIVVGIVAVVLALLVATYSISVGRSSHNPLFYICTAGAVLFMAGVVGQRSYVLNSSQTASNCPTPVGGNPKPWDASIAIPWTPIHVDVVALIGLFVIMVGFCLLLFFERIDESPAEIRPRPRPGSFEQEDTI